MKMSRIMPGAKLSGGGCCMVYLARCQLVAESFSLRGASMVEIWLTERAWVSAGLNNSVLGGVYRHVAAQPKFSLFIGLVF